LILVRYAPDSWDQADQRTIEQVAPAPHVDSVEFSREVEKDLVEED
jgi:hypothetical protein